jgi:hypothetical protein
MECTQVIKAGDVVSMMMREKNCVKLLDICTKHLLAEVGACVNKNGSGLCLDESTYAEAFISGVS